MPDNTHAYATVAQVAAGFRPIENDEVSKCEALIEEAGIMIDAAAANAAADVKMVATCRMVRRALGNGGQDVPMGATQGSVAALGYSQSWTMSGGSTGELYLGKAEKALLGISNKIGASNPFEVGVCFD